jgi:Glycosyl hydrolase family 3 N terminal domain
VHHLFAGRATAWYPGAADERLEQGIVNLDFRPGDTATALLASIVLASSFNHDLARTGGQMIAREARSRGFNVQLAGGVNLARDPRNGPGTCRGSFPGAALVARPVARWARTWRQ